MKRNRRGFQWMACLLVAVFVALSARVPVSAAEGITIINGGSIPAHAASVGEYVEIYVDPSYDPSYQDYLFWGWGTLPGEEYLLDLLDSGAEETGFIMPSQSVYLIANVEIFDIPGPPTITDIVGHDGGLTVYWDPPMTGTWPTAYVIEDGYNAYWASADDRSLQIDGLENGKPYSIVVMAAVGWKYGEIAQMSGTAGDPAPPIIVEPEPEPTSEPLYEPAPEPTLPPKPDIVEDLNTLIGEAGHLNGILAQAIGVSGTYDPQVFTATSGVEYPSIRLTLNNIPDAEIIFSNPRHYRQEILDDGAVGGADEHRYAGYADRYGSKTRFEPFCQVTDVERTVEDEKNPGVLIYNLHFADGKTLAACDLITAYENSDGILHMRYRKEDEEAVRQEVQQLLSTLTLTEGVRPTLTFAQYDCALDQELDETTLMAQIQKLETCFDVDVADRRLHSELLGDAFLSLQADCYDVVQNCNQTYSEALESGLDDGAFESIQENFSDLEIYGFTVELARYGSTPQIVLHFRPEVFFPYFKDMLPERDRPLLEYLEDNAADFQQPDFQYATGDWLQHMTSVSVFATMMGDGAVWTDPIWKIFARRIADSFLGFVLVHDAGGYLNEPVYEAYVDYEEFISTMKTSLADGQYEERIGFYADAIFELKKRIIERDGVLSDALLPFLEEINFFNGGPVG